MYSSGFFRPEWKIKKYALISFFSLEWALSLGNSSSCHSKQMQAQWTSNIPQSRYWSQWSASSTSRQIQKPLSLSYNLSSTSVRDVDDGRPDMQSMMFTANVVRDFAVFDNVSKCYLTSAVSFAQPRSGPLTSCSISWKTHRLASLS